MHKPTRLFNILNYTVSGKKDIQSSMNNFNKFKRDVTVFGTHYPNDMFY